LHIFNINNPTNTIEIGAFTLWGALNVKIGYPYAYAAISNGLGTGFSILDISNLVNPIELSRRDSLWNFVGSGSGALSISNSFAYFTGGGTTLFPRLRSEKVASSRQLIKKVNFLKLLLYLFSIGKENPHADVLL
jgi:hypothetical protein